VLLYAAQHYPIWRKELEMAAIDFGAFGENFTVEGWTEENVCIGDVFRVGEAVIQISQPRLPCWKLDRRFGQSGIRAAVEQSGRTGWYARVITEAYVQAGDAITLVDRPFPDYTVTFVKQSLTSTASTAADLRAELAQCPVLAISWREMVRQ